MEVTDLTNLELLDEYVYWHLRMEGTAKDRDEAKADIRAEFRRRDDELAKLRIPSQMTNRSAAPEDMRLWAENHDRYMAALRKPTFVNLDKPLMTMTLFAGKEHQFIVVNGVSADDLKTDERLRDAFETVASIFEGKATE